MSRHYKFDIWDVIIWLSLIILSLYVIAKLTGLINTPDWVNLLPIITIIFFAGAFYQKVLAFMEKMDVRTNYLKNGLDKTNVNIKAISIQIKKHDSQLKNLKIKHL